MAKTKNGIERRGWWRKESSEEAEKRTRVALANRGQTKTNMRRGISPKAEVRCHKMRRPLLLPYKDIKWVTTAELAEYPKKSGPNPSLGLMAHLASCWLQVPSPMLLGLCDLSPLLLRLDSMLCVSDTMFIEPSDFDWSYTELWDWV